MSETVVDTRDLSMRFGGVQAVNNVNFSLRRPRAALPDRPERRRQEHLLQVPHRPDPPRPQPRPRLHPRPGRDRLARLRDRPPRRRHQDAGAVGDERPHRRGEPVAVGAPRRHARADAGHGRRGACSRCRSRRSRAASSASSRTASASWSRSASSSPSGPWLLLLDEPAAGITGAEADQLVRIIHEVNRNATVVVVDHDMQFVRMLGGRVTVMHQGAILREGPVDEVLADAKVREVYIGSRAQMTDAPIRIAPSGDERRRAATSSSTSPACAPATATCRCCTASTSSCKAGEAVGIVGHNGVGKTTLPEDADRPGADDRRPDLDRRHRRDADEGARPQPARHRLRAAGARHPARPHRAREPAPRVDAGLRRHRAGGDRARRRHAAAARGDSSTARAARSRAASSRSWRSAAR